MKSIFDVEIEGKKEQVGINDGCRLFRREGPDHKWSAWLTFVEDGEKMTRKHRNMVNTQINQCQAMREIDSRDTVDKYSNKTNVWDRKRREKLFEQKVKRQKITNLPPKFRKEFPEELKGWYPKYIPHPLICPHPMKPSACLFDEKKKKCVRPPDGRPCRKVYNRMENRPRSLYVLLKGYPKRCTMFGMYSESTRA